MFNRDELLKLDGLVEWALLRLNSPANSEVLESSPSSSLDWPLLASELAQTRFLLSRHQLPVLSAQLFFSDSRLVLFDCGETTLAFLLKKLNRTALSELQATLTS